jgi:hypothetical protein
MIDEVHSSSDPDEKIIRVAAGTYKPKYKPNSSGDSTPTTETDRDKTFILKEGVKIRGGYVEGEYITEAIRQARFNTDGTVINTAHETVLSGDIGTAASSDNAYHVVLAVGISETNPAVLDGFTITGGYANGSGSLTVDGIDVQQCNGGGVFSKGKASLKSKLELKHVTIKNNHAPGTGTAGTGGGMYNHYSSSVLSAVTISNNTASKAGGGMYNYDSSPTLTDVTISGNTVNATTSSDGMGGGIFNGSSSAPTLLRVRIIGNKVSNTVASDPNGGGMYISTSSAPVLINVLISGNLAVSTSDTDQSKGGGIYIAGSTASLVNVTIAGNYAAFGGAINPGAGSTTTIVNSVIWDNVAGDNYDGINTIGGGTVNIFNSLVEGNNSTSNGNLDGTVPGNDPLFISSVPVTSTDATTGGNYRLNTGSPVRNLGDDDEYLDARDITDFTGEKDLGGGDRKKGSAIDMGAYEKE